MNKIFRLIFLFPLWWTASAQQTIHVPVNQPTIQSGINAAQDGDTVLVAPGIYTENIDFKGKLISVTSGATDASGAAATVLQPANEGSIVTFQTGETPAALLNGFTIEGGFSLSNGSGAGGDGIDIIGASPTIKNNVITGNTGCGIFAQKVIDLTIQANFVVGNVADGGGNQHCGASFDWFDNRAGIGIYIRGGNSAQIIGNTIGNNSFDQINFDAIPHILIQNNLIQTTTAGLGGFVSSSAPPPDVKLIQNVIYNTMLTTAGWGTTTVDTAAELGNFIYVQNTIYNTDLGIENSPAYAKIANNAFGFNSSEYGGTLKVVDFKLLDCENTTTYEYSKLVANNNDIDSEGISSIRTSCPLSTANLDADPQFLSTNPSTFDFHTQRTSPVVGAGDINAPLIPPTDFAGKNRTVCGTIDMGAYQVHPQPPITVIGSPNPSVGGSTVTFTAQLTGNCNVPTGTITFVDGANALGTSVLASNASASFSTAGLTVGSHTITVTYPGDFNFDPGTSPPLIQVVTGYPTATTLSVSPNPAKAFTPITLTSTVTSAFGTPTGTVTFTANGQTLASAVLNSNGIATTTLSSLGAGTYNIIATYSADVHFAASSSATVIEIVTGADSVTSLTATPNPAYFGQTVTLNIGVRAAQGNAVPVGTVVLTDGSTPLGTVTLDSSGKGSFNTSTLALGSHTITATYSGTSNFNTSNAYVIEVVTAIQSSLALTASPNPAAVNQTVTITAAATSSVGTQVSSGTVSFYDGATLIDTTSVDGTGHASFSTTTLAIGPHNLTAVYAGSTTFGTSTSPVFQETILPSAFALTLSPSTITLHGGQQGSASVQLSSIGLFAGSLSLSHGALPMYGSASLSPGSVTLTAGGTASSTLSLTTFLKAANQELPFCRQKTSVAIWASVFLLLLPIRKRWRKQTICLLIVWFSLMTTSGLMGCTNSYYTANLVATGTYQIPVTAIDVNGNTQTAILTVVVTP